MANSTCELSEKLKNFKSSYDSAGGIGSITEAASTFSSNLQSISSELSNAISQFKESGNDSVINSIVANASLAKDGLDRVKSHIDSDIPSVIGKIDEVIALIAEIETLVESYNTESTNLNNARHPGKDKDGNEIEVDQKKVSSLNTKCENIKKQISDKNSKGESQLDIIKAAMDGINFGVAGNMNAGGVLGASVAFGDNYIFEWDDFTVPADLSSEDAPGGDGEVEDTIPENDSDAKKAGKFRVVNTEEELKTALRDGVPIKLTKSLHYRWQYGMFAQKGWEEYEASEDKPLYLMMDNDGSNNHWIVVDKDGNRVTEGKYKDMFVEKDHVLDNNRAFFNGDLKTDEDGYVVVDNEEDFKTALIQEKPIKLTKQLNYRWQYGMFAQKGWETYDASEEKPIYLTMDKDGSNNHWVVTNKDGVRVTEGKYKDMFVEKDHVLDNSRSYFSNSDMKTDDNGYVIVNNEEDLKTALRDDSPIKLTKQLNYRWQYGMFAQKGWEIYDATEAKPLYLKKDGSTKNWVVVDESGNRVTNGKYKDMFLEKDHVLDNNRAYFSDK